MASASADKLRENQEVQDLIQALGCGTGAHYSDERLRYERVIIMTDADVDGAHIASLLMTFFYREMPKLIENGHLFLAQPPLYRITKGGKTEYARDDAQKDELLRTTFRAARSRSAASRAWARCSRCICARPRWTRPSASCSRSTCRRPCADTADGRRDAMKTATLVEDLMGRKPEKRYAFIQENAKFARDLDV